MLRVETIVKIRLAHFRDGRTTAWSRHRSNCVSRSSKFSAARISPEARNQETGGMKSYGGFGTYVGLGPLFGLHGVGIELRLQAVEKLIGQFFGHAADETRAELSELAANPTIHVV